MMKYMLLVVLLVTHPVVHASEINIIIGTEIGGLQESELGDSMTLITEKKISRSDKTDIANSIDGIAGLSVVQSGTLGGNTSVYSKGQKGEYTAIMIDGVNINDPMTPARTSNISIINPIYLQRVQVLNNPQSGLYGSDTIGGIVNFVTLPRENENSITFGYDSYGAVNSAIALSKKSENIAYYISGSRLLANGFTQAGSKLSQSVENDKYENTSIAGSLKLNISDNSNISVYHRNIKVDNDLDNGAYNQDPNYISQNEFNISKIEFTNAVSRAWTWAMSADYFQSKRIYENLPDVLDTDSMDSWYKGSNMTGKFTNVLSLGESFVFEGGLEYKNEKGSSYYHSNGFWGPYESSFDEKSAAEKAVYLKNQMLIGKKLSISMGLRLAHNDIFKEYSAYSLYSSYASGKNTFNVGWGTAFKTPSLYQLYSSFGDESLKPDEGASFDIGYTRKIFSGKSKISFSYFKSASKNMIDYDSAISKYANIGRTRSEGVQTQIDIKLSQRYKMNLVYNRLSAIDLENKTALLRRAKNSIHGDILYQYTEKGFLKFSSKYRGARYDMDEFYARTKMEPYFISDITASYPLMPEMIFNIGIKNIFNADYEDAYGYYSLRRSYYCGLKTRF